VIRRIAGSDLDAIGHIGSATSVHGAYTCSPLRECANDRAPDSACPHDDM
jgi:hypothetical protein